ALLVGAERGVGGHALLGALRRDLGVQRDRGVAARRRGVARVLGVGEAIGPPLVQLADRRRAERRRERATYGDLRDRAVQRARLVRGTRAERVVGVAARGEV